MNRDEILAKLAAGEISTAEASRLLDVLEARTSAAPPNGQDKAVHENEGALAHGHEEREEDEDEDWDEDEDEWDEDEDRNLEEDGPAPPATSEGKRLDDARSWMSWVGLGLIVGALGLFVYGAAAGPRRFHHTWVDHMMKNQGVSSESLRSIEDVWREEYLMWYGLVPTIMCLTGALFLAGAGWFDRLLFESNGGRNKRKRE